MSLTALFRALRNQGLVVGATAVVAVAAIGVATTGSPNPLVWGGQLVDNFHSGDHAPLLLNPSPSPQVSPASKPSPEATETPYPAGVEDTPAAEPTESPARETEGSKSGASPSPEITDTADSSTGGDS